MFLGKILALMVPLSTQVYIRWVPANFIMGDSRKYPYHTTGGILEF